MRHVGLCHLLKKLNFKESGLKLVRKLSNCQKCDNKAVVYSAAY